jgi:hypothetical protein
MWASLEGRGSDAKKRMFLFAWIKDPSWGKLFVKNTES